MRSGLSGFSIARSLLLFAALPTLALPAMSQARTSPQPAAQAEPAPATEPAATTSVSSAPAPAPKAPVGPPNLKKMSPKQIADLAAYNMALASLAVEHYTYKETEHNQNYIDGKLVVDHTTVTENIFINNLPYMRKIMFDGKPLEGKELKAEQKLYDDAVKERRALDEAARARITKGALRSVSSNINRLSTNFVLKLDGHQTIDGEDCVILDAMPPPDNKDPELAQHIRIALEADTGDVLDVNIENLEDQNGFSKGTVQHLRYKIVGANPLLESEVFDSVVRFKELLGKPITIHRERTYTDYKRFRATVTIKSFSVATDKDLNAPDTPADGTPAVAPAGDRAATGSAPVEPSADAKPAEKVKLTPEEKARLKADEKAKAEADAKAKAEAKAQAQADAKAKAEADAKARADAKAQAAEQARARALADAQARQEAKAKADAEAKAQLEARAEAKAKADAEAKANADAKAQAKAEADAKAKADAEEKAKAKAQQAALAKQDAEDKARLKAELARAEADAKAKMKAQADEIARQEAETRAKLKEQSKEQARLDAATRAQSKADADAKSKTPNATPPPPAQTTDPAPAVSGDQPK